MDDTAEVSRYSAHGIVDWYSYHAAYLKGDENSDEYYSDDESEEDPIDLKRTRKEVTGILRSHTNYIVEGAKEILQRFPDAYVGNPTITSKGIYLPIEGVESPLELSDDVSQIDPLTETRIDHRRATEYNATIGQTSRAFKTWLIYDPVPLVRDYLVSRRWKWNVAIGIFFVLLGAIQLHFAWTKLSAYVNFQWAVLVLLAPVAVHRFVMASPLSGYLPKPALYAILFGAVAVLYMILVR